MLRGLFFFVFYMIVYQNALTPRKLACPKKLMITRLSYCFRGTFQCGTYQEHKLTLTLKLLQKRTVLEFYFLNIITEAMFMKIWNFKTSFNNSALIFLRKYPKRIKKNTNQIWTHFYRIKSKTEKRRNIQSRTITLPNEIFPRSCSKNTSIYLVCALKWKQIDFKSQTFFFWKTNRLLSVCDVSN